MCGGYAGHAASREWLTGALSSTPRVGVPWQTLLAFLRLVSNRRVFAQPVPVRTAWKQVTLWLERDNVWVPTPGPGHSAILGDLLACTNGGDHVPDAHLGALAIEHGLQLCSADQGFARYPGLRFHNPLR